MLRVFYKDAEGEWWLDGDRDAHLPDKVASLSELPPPLRENLTILSLAHEGATIDGIGKRVSRDTFWLFV